MKRTRNLSFVASVLLVVCYLAFAVLAYSRYPMPYSPLSNWLSDQGNTDANPHGAVFYNAGIISTGLLLMLFFLGLSRWRMENKRVQIVMVRLTQAFGVLGCICMLMTAVYPINNLETHSFWSTSLYVMLSSAFVFLAAALRYHPQVPRWLLVLGISTAVVVLLTSFLKTVYVLEWITVFLFLCYVSLVGAETKRL